MICPYQPCGSHEEECSGCVHDPLQRSMTLQELLDLNPCIRCFDCKHYKGKADLPGAESTCKRLDHKHVKFYTAPFKSYDCNGPICSDFEPGGPNRFLIRHWKPEFLKEWVAEFESERPVNRYVALILDGDRKTMYHVRYEDFFYGRFLNEDGTLNWFRKQYQKVVRKSSDNSLGFTLVSDLRTDGS